MTGLGSADEPSRTRSAERWNAIAADGVGAGGEGLVEGEGEGEAEGLGSEEDEGEGVGEGLGSAWAGAVRATRPEPTKTAQRGMPKRRLRGVRALAAVVGIGAVPSLGRCA
ncbi:hypothetical protein GCM10026982_43610 [Nocardiopsis aegyptia]